MNKILEFYILQKSQTDMTGSVSRPGENNNLLKGGKSVP